jgi:hypothetical protein
MIKLKDGTRFNPSSIIGKMRYALALADYESPPTYRFFTHVRKDGTRRVKFWMADRVFDSSQKQQQMLESCLKFAYGTRYKGGYFMKNPFHGYNKTSFCIILEN